jgi:hypothetical protein
MKYDKKEIFESVAKHFKYISGLVINLPTRNNKILNPLRFLNNVINIKTMVHLHQDIDSVIKFWLYRLDPLGFMLPKTFKLLLKLDNRQKYMVL